MCVCVDDHPTQCIHRLSTTTQQQQQQQPTICALPCYLLCEHCRLRTEKGDLDLVQSVNVLSLSLLSVVNNENRSRTDSFVHVVSCARLLPSRTVVSSIFVAAVAASPFLFAVRLLSVLCMCVLSLVPFGSISIEIDVYHLSLCLRFRRAAEERERESRSSCRPFVVESPKLDFFQR